MSLHVAGSELKQLTATIKRARSTLMVRGAPGEVVILHRKVEVEHTVSEFCACCPLVIGQNDYRPSLYFANQVLNPVLH